MNIGDRQKGRIETRSVINCHAKSQNISAAISSALALKSKNGLVDIKNPYGNGGASQRIINILEKINLNGIIKRNFMISDSVKKPIRIIPRLDIKGPNLVKGIHLEGLRVLGKPHVFAKCYYDNGADELFFQDVVASLYGRNSMKDIIRKTASEIFIPLTVAGGIRTIEDINGVLRCGADKVAINTAAIGRKDFIKEASEKFGSSTIVVAIEAIKESNGKYFAYTDNGREFTGVDALEWAEEVVALGAGELIVTSVDNEGTGEGFDLELLGEISRRVGIPVIGHGGAGNAEHVKDLFNQTNVDGVAVASMLHYNLIKNESFSHKIENGEGNTEFLKRNHGFKTFELCSIIEIKDHLLKEDFIVRK